jgi:type I restriction-modification system DNA methylase subunit
LLQIGKYVFTVGIVILQILGSVLWALLRRSFDHRTEDDEVSGLGFYNYATDKWENYYGEAYYNYSSFGVQKRLEYHYSSLLIASSLSVK